MHVCVCVHVCVCSHSQLFSFLSAGDLLKNCCHVVSDMATSSNLRKQNYADFFLSLVPLQAFSPPKFYNLPTETQSNWLS